MVLFKATTPSIIGLTVIYTRIIFTQAHLAIDDNGCRTPFRGVGTCMVAHNCQPFIQFIQQPENLTPKSIEVLQNYQCGYKGSAVKVCCPRNGHIAIAKIKIPEAPDISKHKNLNLLPSDCGTLWHDDLTTNKEEASLFEFPWIVLLSIISENDLDLHCEGSIINDLYILTAAHCIAKSELGISGVRVGEHNLASMIDCDRDAFGIEICSPPVQDLTVEEVIPHPNFNSTTYSDDIGLIRLASPIRLNIANAKPICLPTKRALRNQNLINANLTVAGWGVTETDQRITSLAKFEVPVITEEECRREYKNSPIQINAKKICTDGKNRRASCGTGTGAPLQEIEYFDDDFKYVQHGIVSFRPQLCNQETLPGVYTRIDLYMDWILDNIKPEKQVEEGFHIFLH